MFNMMPPVRKYEYQKNGEPLQRRAGILLHISSLPGKYGTGDFGEEALRFVDLMNRAGQSYWQTLPLSPLAKNAGWSPYSSPSAFAGNPLFISPDTLYSDGLLNKDDLDVIKFRTSARSDFDKAGLYRDILIPKAYNNLHTKRNSTLRQKFADFCESEKYWLNDYSLFMAYKSESDGRKWNLWPAKIRNRDEKTLKRENERLQEEILLEKFRQFLFSTQWRRVKEYANGKGLKIFGDIPFYVSYDSADVWANQELFKLDSRKKMITVAGVPPDYFNDQGQLWNMPVFDWGRMKSEGYHWWMKRLGKNLEMFDLLRIDHFRAFSAYWEVAAGEKTAKKGEWIKGPGSDFFRTVKEQFPEMPFVAEDLGLIDQDVYDLKDEFNLPGMQVLQFSFDYDMHRSIHTPHNHRYNSLVYTGTHDNNTIMGWYENELSAEGRQRLHEYAGLKIKTSESHFEMIQMAFASDARLVIIPMQDYLGLGKEARMNTPATKRGNWLWKLKDFNEVEGLVDGMRKVVEVYGRKEV